MPRVGSDEITIKNILDGDSSRTVYLFQNGTSSPTVPLNTAGFVASTGVASSTGSWSTIATVPASGSTLYVASLSLRQPNSTGNWEAVGNWEANPGSSSGADGSPAPRFVSRRLYASSSTGTPGAPSAILTWSTLALSSITAGTPSATWSETAPTAVATSTTLVYFSDLLFIDVTGIATTSSDTGTTPKEGISFSGLVTFNNGDFALNGSPVTSIDGGNISTGTIDADQINVNAITSKNIKAGNITLNTDGEQPIPQGTTAGTALVGQNNGIATGTTAGDFVVGSSDQYLSWDESAGILQIAGRITSLNPAALAGLDSANYSVIVASSTNLSSQLDGAGYYSFVMCGGGGKGGSYDTDDSTSGAKGGGSSGLARFSFKWDGTTTLAFTRGLGATGTSPGGTSTFTVGGTTLATTTGGSAGGNQGSSSVGGAGGTASIVSGVVDLLFSHTTSGSQGSNSSPGGGAGIQFLNIVGEAPNTTSAPTYIYGGSVANTDSGTAGLTTGGITRFTPAADTDAVNLTFMGRELSSGYFDGGYYESANIDDNQVVARGGVGGVFSGGGAANASQTAQAVGGAGGYGGGGGGARADGARSGGYGGNGVLFFKKL